MVKVEYAVDDENDFDSNDNDDIQITKNIVTGSKWDRFVES